MSAPQNSGTSLPVIDHRVQDPSVTSTEQSSTSPDDNDHHMDFDENDELEDSYDDHAMEDHDESSHHHTISEMNGVDDMEHTHDHDHEQEEEEEEEERVFAAEAAAAAAAAEAAGTAQSNALNQVGAPTSQQQAGSGQQKQTLQQLPSAPAFYSLFDNPPNLGRIRQLLFELKEPTEISVEEYERYWPFVDNVWVKQRSNSTKGGLMTTDYYMCRLRRPTCRGSTAARTPPVDGKKLRNKKRREGSTCNVQIKVVKFEGAYTTVTISKTPGSSRSHSHDLDYIDKVKRNSGLLEYAKKEAKKGYLPSSIYAKFREEPQKLLDAGGKFFTITDVRNISAKWRSLYPTATLKTHEGYSYQQGYGVVRIQDPNASALPPPSVFESEKPQLAPDALPFPDYDLSFLEPYLHQSDEPRVFPHVTLSYACSLDAKISLQPGIMTLLSGPESKLMTHYLRSRHDAVIIGIGTALADDPGLNCRLDGAGGYGGLGRMWQPRPIIVDPTGRWQADPNCKMLQYALKGKGKAPWIIISPGANVEPEKLVVLKGHGGDYLRIVEYNQNWLLRWEAIFRALAAEGIKSVMVEGGGTVMSELLNPEYRDFVDSIVVTVAPTYLGAGGVAVSPDSKKDESGNPVNALSPREVRWQPLGQDVIMCGKIRLPPPHVNHQQQQQPLPSMPTSQQSDSNAAAAAASAQPMVPTGMVVNSPINQDVNAAGSANAPHMAPQAEQGHAH
ncbi:phosphatidylinositol-binding protein scs2 [Ascosphaera pollenicola]|nr:phosphatidylinositol-binding protein scs2 [Ascosphaera pollenicola]